ncbi:MAG: trigger factor [Candidatus Gracilibacteria bacterium]|nr:trigger factor [Candidatus Gracilibacteria bacterium]MDD3120374.1 trigger factor [Candidatus Gracilibacteria bacterium]MDD4530408.1 trigger factor [Candidatus Gracilibacteria bacterium]
MQNEIKKINAYTVEITIKASSKEYEQERKKAIDEIKKHASFPGFRKGTVVPDDMVIAKYGEEFLEEKISENLANKNYQKLLMQSKIIPVSAGGIKEIKSINPFEAVIEVEILPEVKIDEKKMEKIKLKKTSAEVTNEEVDAKIKEIESKFQKFEEAESGAIIEKGDKVTIDTQGFDKKGGVALEQTKVDAFPLLIGSNTFIPGFEEKLIGEKVGEVVEFDITFPTNYHSADFAGKKVFFMTTIFKIERAGEFQWTEEFIEGIRGVKTDLVGLKDIIKSEIADEKEYQSRMKDETTLLQELEKIAEFEVGPNLVATEIKRVYDEHSHSLEQQGVKLKDYLDHIRQDEEKYKEEVIKPEAIRRLNAELILNEIRELKKDIDVTNEEISEEIDKIFAKYQNPEAIEKLRTILTPGNQNYEDIKGRLRYKKIIDTFFE